MSAGRKRMILISLALIGPLAALWVWLTALSFVPVPWPDDSAFYFVAKDFFHWPPRWVMLPQAPFEPTYRIWNFNTMPLYPILIGLGRFIGIDGSHALKFWPLSFWALSGSVFAVGVYRAGLPALLAALFALAFAMDPALRWASVLVRPESLIGLCGVILVTGLSLGWFKQEERSQSFWDPIAALLAIAAYAHFNAVHLLFAVIPVLILRPRRLIDIGIKATIYLFPWLLTVALKPQLFVKQMTLQWQRLAVHNGWLDSTASAIHSLYQNLGSPEDWPPVLFSTSAALWLVIIAAFCTFAIKVVASFWQKVPKGGDHLLAPSGWVVGAVWLWHNKPEVWFTYYIHLAVWTFLGLATLRFWKRFETQKEKLSFAFPMSLATAFSAVLVVVFCYVNATQASKLGNSHSWNWDTYRQYVSCIDDALSKQAEKQGKTHGFEVWAPTFPDITIELSRRHPDWQFSRTNDFGNRSYLAIQHGYQTDAVVVTETINWYEREIDSSWSQHPEVHSIWMDWKDYYLNHFMTVKGWKPERHLCQKGRWQAFIFMNATADPTAAPAAPAQSGSVLTAQSARHRAGKISRE